MHAFFAYPFFPIVPLLVAIVVALVVVPMVSIVAYLCCTLHSAWHFFHVPTMRAALVTANVCRRRVAAAVAASVPAPEATPEPVSGPESECFICLICLFPPTSCCCCCSCCVVFLAVTLVLIALAVPARLGSGSATRTAMIMLQTCRINRAGPREAVCLCVWQVWHGCIYINVLCVLNVCVCVGEWLCGFVWRRLVKHL